MISTSDIKLYASLKQKKYRREHKMFLIEGFHLIEECLSSSFNLELIILRNDLDLSSHPEILAKISKNKTRVDALPESTFNKLIETENSQGIIGVVEIPEQNLKSEPGNIIIALESINDPGNLGTIIRTAYWFGVKTILLSENSADAFNSKTVRSSQGGLFHVNIYEDVALLDELKKLKSKNYNVEVFSLSGNKKLENVDKTNSVLVFGSEAHGVSDEISNAGFDLVKIEGKSECESLNVAISCGIALYELTK